MTKRVLVGVLLAGATTLALAACGSDSASDSPSGSPSEGGGLTGSSVTYVSWGGNLQEAEEAAFTQPFAEQTGATVTTDSPTDYAKIKAMVEAGQVTWDVVHADPFFIVANCDTMFEKLDPAVVTNLAQIDPTIKHSACDLPHMRYGIVLYYNAEKYADNPPTSWADFFDTAKYPGKRGAWGYSQNGMIEAALLADGVPPDQLYPLDLDRAFTKLDTVKDDMVWTQGPGQVSEQVLSGAVDMAVAYSGRAYDAAAEGAKWAVAWNAPTIVSWESVGVVKGTKNEDAAMALVNYFGDADAQARFAETIPYSPTNTQSKPQLDDLSKEFSVTEHPEAETVALDQDWWAKNFDTANQRWTDWQAG